MIAGAPMASASITGRLNPSAKVGDSNATAIDAAIGVLEAWDQSCGPDATGMALWTDLRLRDGKYYSVSWNVTEGQALAGAAG